ncbi:oligosaccharide flippase family protein [Marinifilum fragile]|uniref:lipopolysaccharide biosynthesis protein n=1 Tax=Marinifilum fragile TaxID=570161 RepID=UPI002AA75A19|nr:oligosaccharide flippase family protein [Marinifilum fragile]
MIKKIISNSFFKNISVLVTGTVIAQILPISIQPILKRLFEPEVFGAFDIYLKTLGVLCVIFTLSYEYGIVIPKRQVSAVNILYTLLVLSLSLFILSELIIIVCYEWIIEVLKFPVEYGYALYILPLSALFFTLSSSMVYLLIREKKFKSISVTKVGKRGSEGVTQLVGGFMGKSSGLFIGDLIGNIICLVLSIKASFKSFNFWNSHYSYNVFKKVICKYFYIPRDSFIPVLINSLAMSSITFTVLYKFNIVMVGYLELTQKILIVPTALVGTAVSKVVLEQVSSARQNKISCYRKVLFVFLFLVCISVPFFIIILMWGKEIFEFIFGSEWAISGIYAETLIYAAIISFMISPLSTTLIGLDKFKINALWMYLRIGLYVTLFVIPFKELSDYLIWYVIVEIFIYLIYLFIISYSLFTYEKNLRTSLVCFDNN